MTALRPWRTPAGLHHGDHACWTFADNAELRDALVPFLDEGRQHGEQLLVTGGPREQLLDALSDLPHRDAMLASGQLDIRASADQYAAGGTLDPAAQVQVLRAEMETALARGRTGLRIAADVTALARDPAVRPGLHRYEELVDDIFAGAPLTAMCMYDASLGENVVGPLAVLHRLQHHGDREPVGHLSGRGGRLALHGEVDLSVADHVQTALLDLARATAGDVVLDLSGLDFLDVAGARMLARAIRTLEADGVRLWLTGARRPVLRCLALFDLVAEEAEPA